MKWHGKEMKRMNWGPVSNVPENEAKSEHSFSNISFNNSESLVFSCTGFVM